MHHYVSGRQTTMEPSGTRTPRRTRRTTSIDVVIWLVWINATACHGTPMSEAQQDRGVPARCIETLAPDVASDALNTGSSRIGTANEPTWDAPHHIPVPGLPGTLSSSRNVIVLTTCRRGWPNYVTGCVYSPWQYVPYSCIAQYRISRPIPATAREADRFRPS